MKKLIVVILCALPLFTQASVGSFFTEADAFFKKYVKNGRVAYKAINQNFSEVRSLYDQIGALDLSTENSVTRKAFYINAYNLIVINQVAKYYPLRSALDQSGFFDKVKHEVAGETMTLNYLEIKKLVLPFKEPRIHFVLACAAVSCPPLASYAYMPNKLNHQLEERTRLALNDSQWLKIRKDQQKVLLSKIFEWYKNDFTMNGQTVIAFINNYRDQPIPDSYSVGYYSYDWSLNDM